MRSFPALALAATAALLTTACDSSVSATVAAPPGTESQPASSAASTFPIDVRFIGDVPDDVRAAARAAAARWMQVLVGPGVPYQATQSGGSCGFAPALTERVPGVVVFVRMSAPDSLVSAGANGGSCAVRPGTLITFEGGITVSTPGLENSRQAGYLGTIFLHELGHVLGIGTNWFASPYLHDATGANPVFAGPKAMQAAFEVGASASAATPVPISRPGESGALTHWRTPALGNDIMLSGGGSALTVVSVAALGDLGYAVSLSAVDPYVAR